MTRLRTLQSSFASGELDSKLSFRKEVKHYYTGAKRMRNVLAIPQGGFRTRDGSIYMQSLPEKSPGVLTQVKYVKFEFSTSQTYLFVFHHLKARIFRNNVQVAEIDTPFEDTVLNAVYDGDNLVQSGIAVAQDLDTLLVFSEQRRPVRIQRQGDDATWLVDDWPLKNIPRFRYGDTDYTNGVNEVQTLEFPSPSGGEWTAGDTFSLILEDEDTKNIQYNATIGTLAARIQDALRSLPNTSATGITASGSGSTVTVTFSGDDGNRPWGNMGYEIKSAANVPEIQIVVTTEGEFAGEDVWSDTRGWPRCGEFHQGRLLMAGSKSRPQTFWGSRPGDPTDFNSRKTLDDYAIVADADEGEVSAFYYIHIGRHIQLFSSSAEFYVPISELDPITPNNFILRKSTERGAKAGLVVYDIDGATVFTQKDGRTLREFIYTDAERAYVAQPISLLASHLMRDPIAMTYREAETTDEADYLFFCNPDGTQTTFCTLRNQDVNAFTLVETQGQYIDCEVVGTTIYLCVQRDLNGTQTLCLERYELGTRLDSAVKADVSTPTSSASVPHLDGMTVSYILDGSIQQKKQVVGGVLTFARPAEESYEIGLEWPDVTEDGRGLQWEVKMFSPEVALSDGPMVGRKMRISAALVSMQDTTGLKVGNNNLSFRRFGSDLLDKPIEPFTGLRRVKGIKGWGYENELPLGDDVATFATVLGVALTVSV